MTTTQLFVGIGADQRVSSRVLKPPGGGSSIVFDEDEHQVKGKVNSPTPQAPAKEVSPQQAASPKPETNGMATSLPNTPNTTTTPPSDPAINGPTTNGTATNGTATNGTATNSSATSGSDDSFPPINGTAMNGTGSTGSLSQGSPSSRSSPSSPSTPSSARQDTQNRLFGGEPMLTTPARRIRDHQRSNIFTPDDNSARHASNGTPKLVMHRTWNRRDPVTGVGVACWDLHAPRCKRKAPAPAVASEGLGENRAPEQPKSQRQRIPPGGFSTQLW